MSTHLHVNGTDVDIRVEKVGSTDYMVKVSTDDAEQDLYLGKFELHILAMKILQVLANE